jgi:tryptophanyl-tRNA synthetase
VITCPIDQPPPRRLIDVFRSFACAAAPSTSEHPAMALLTSTRTDPATPAVNAGVILSGIKPTGHLTLGNYLGALRRFSVHRHDTTCLFPVVDLHALTVPGDPARLRALTREVALLYLASGIDPSVSVVFRQSDVSAHTGLAYLLECVATTGELGRMIQYKEKGRQQPGTRASLFTYPVLMAADILAYGTTHVPVGDDQRQHLELTRAVATRFNATYGPAFVVPEMLPAAVAARVMDLAEPADKMSKDSPDDAPGVIRMLDGPDVVVRKVKRALTDPDPDLAYDPDSRPGVANLLEILGACTGEPDIAGLAAGLHGAAELKTAVADAVVATLAPVQARYLELAADEIGLARILREGADRASAMAAGRVELARTLMGLR